MLQRMKKMINQTAQNLAIHRDETLRDFDRYFKEKIFAFNDYLEIIIQFACKVFKIDILLIQCQSNHEVEDRNTNTEYTLIRNLFNEPQHGNSFITLFRTSRNELSHYQLLIPTSYDINLTTRDNIIRHMIDINTDEYVDLKCDSETQSLASNDSMSQDSNASFSSNASFNSSTSSTNSQKKFKRKTHFTSGKTNKKAVAKNQKTFEERQRETDSQKDERRQKRRERYSKKSEVEKDLLKVNDKYRKKIESCLLPEASKSVITFGKTNKKAVEKNQKAFEKRQRETDSQKDERRRKARERYSKKSEVEKDLLKVNDKYRKKIERCLLTEASKSDIALLKKIWHLHRLLKETPDQEKIRLEKKKNCQDQNRKRETNQEKLARLEKDANRHFENYEFMNVEEKLEFLNIEKLKRLQETEEQRIARLEKKKIYDRERRAKRTEDQKQYEKDYQKNYREFNKERKKNEKINYEDCLGYFDRNNFDEGQYLEHYLGPMNQECENCGSMNFEAERVNGHFSICCHNGKIQLDTPMWPRDLSNLYEGKGLPQEIAAKAKEPKPRIEVEPERYEKPKIVKSSNDFGESIRTYNNSFAFASTSVKLPEPFRNMKNNAGNTFVKIQGQIQHRASMLKGKDTDKPCFAQTYLVDDEFANELRMDFITHFTPSKDIMKFLSDTMRDYSPYIEHYHNLQDKVSECKEGDVPVIGMYFQRNLEAGQNPKTYNLPTYGGEMHVPQGRGVISACFVTDQDNLPSKSNFLIYPKNDPTNQQQYIYDNNDHCEPMCYPLLFPLGESGYHWNMKHVQKPILVPSYEDKEEVEQKYGYRNVTPKQYAAYRLMLRREQTFKNEKGQEFCSAKFHLGRKLLQLYIVDCYIRAENQTLRWFKRNTKQLRVDKYKDLAAYLKQKAVDMTNDLNEHITPGNIFVVPSTFSYGPRYMAQALEDACSILVDLDELHPDLFVTFTTNPNWKEIQDNLAPGQTYVDRPDLVARVFQLKLKHLMHVLTKGNWFGKTKCHFYVVEFQKRGLPHAHILIILEDSSKIDEKHIDNFITAELPDKKHTRLYENFKKYQIHTPCNWKEDEWRFCRYNRESCEKHFPKDFCEKTVNKETGYTEYMRRDIPENYFTIQRKKLVNGKEMLIQKALFQKHGIFSNKDKKATNIPAPAPTTTSTTTSQSTPPVSQKTKEASIGELTKLLRKSSILESTPSQSQEPDSMRRKSYKEFAEEMHADTSDDFDFNDYHFDVVDSDDEDHFVLQDEHVFESNKSKNSEDFVTIDGVQHIVLKPVYETVEFVITNQWVVPTNYGLSLIFNSHINVESCGTMRTVKYIFKYIYKGGDCANLVITQEANKKLDYDEVKNRMDTRYVSSPEACWRIFEFDMQGKSHFVYRLTVHLPDEQPMVFDPNDLDNDFDTFQERLDADSKKFTRLTGWFELNKVDQEARQYRYVDLAEFYTWQQGECKWQPRQRGGEKAISRVYSVSIQKSELFYLRLLLFNVTGCTSFEDIRTTYDEFGNSVIHPTFKEAAVARNLTLNDREFDLCLTEAATSRMPYQLRQLFFQICQEGTATNFRELYENHKESMWEDYKIQWTFRNELTITVVVLEQLLLKELNRLFESISMNNAKYGLDMPDLASLGTEFTCGDNKQFNFSRLSIDENLKLGQTMLKQLNKDQLNAYNQIMESINVKIGKNHFWVDGCGGTGKTFLLNTFCHTLRGAGKIVVAVAWTGIAASLIDGASTFHKAFRAPLDLNESSKISIQHQDPYARYLKACDLFIWDEAGQASDFAVNMVDRFLRDLIKVDKPFGGKTFLFTGDFRQTLPIFKFFKVVQILEHTIKRSNMWRSIAKLELTENMRVDPDQIEFKEWLLKVGEGLIPTLPNTDLIAVDNRVVLHHTPAFTFLADQLIDEIYGPEISLEQALATKDPDCIVTPFNVDKNYINSKVLDRLEGDVRFYLGHDSIEEVENLKDKRDRAIYTPEHMAKLQPGNLPPRDLFLKHGALVILLKNLSIAKGLCNGTRMIVTEMKEHVIVCKVITGASQDQPIFINRMLNKSSQNLPVTMVRRQFPLSLAYSLSIDKSQGQTFNQIGMYLPRPCFSHGQFYVGLSRVSKFSSVKVAIDTTDKHGYKKDPITGKLDKSIIYTANVVLRSIFDNPTKSKPPNPNQKQAPKK